MLRVLTTIWFTFFSLLGPGVCCCTLRAAGPSVDSCDTAAPRSCCCDEPIANDDKTANPSPTHDCPCKRTKEVAQTSVSSTVTSTFFSSPIGEYVVAPWHNDLLHSTIIATRGHPSRAHRPFHDTCDILYACHILRC